MDRTYHMEVSFFLGPFRDHFCVFFFFYILIGKWSEKWSPQSWNPYVGLSHLNFLKAFFNREPCKENPFLMLF